MRYLDKIYAVVNICIQDFLELSTGKNDMDDRYLEGLKQSPTAHRIIRLIQIVSKEEKHVFNSFNPISNQPSEQICIARTDDAHPSGAYHAWQLIKRL